MARSCATSCLPLGKHDYTHLVNDPARFRTWIDQCFQAWPELFPAAFQDGYRLKDGRTAPRTGRRLRRIRLRAGGESFSVRPSFLLPYRVGTTDDVTGPLFLRAVGVPFWALARAFGKNPRYGYRLAVSLGRHRVVGTTLRRAELPQHLLADEHHQTRAGDKNYLAPTVGDGCCLGAALAQTANADDLTAAYEVFQQEADHVQEGYPPRTVRVDGWAATHQAWRALFPLVVLLRCFWHGWLNRRSRGQRSASFPELSRQAWEAFHAPDRRSFGQRRRRLLEWARVQSLSAWLLEQVEQLCGRSQAYGGAYGHPGGHRTSNRRDRVVRGMSRYVEVGQHLHGSPEAGGQHVRAWALLQNFRPWGPAAVRDSDGWQCPAERLNGYRYHDDWIQNLQVSASLGGYRR